jgi:predicted ferric reductase
MNPQTWWYVARASGMVAWVLLVASLVWGVLLATRVLKPIDRPAWLLAMHRWLSGLAVVCTGLHLGGLVADNYLHFGWKEILVPNGSPWKTGAVTVGVIALYLLIAVQATSLLMKKLPKRLWRAVHVTSYGLVWSVSVHAALAGTDVTNRVYQGVALLLTIAAVTAAVLRVTAGRRGGSNRPAVKAA